jgi:uncharacterized protein YjbI with pentapeptide repeats
VVRAILVAVISVGYAFKLGWVGVVDFRDATYKTLWDWLKLLIVPAVLAVGGYLFTQSENRRTEEIAKQRAQDEALQAYLDKMSELLIDKNLHEKRDRYHPMRVTARARTLAILSQLDGERKRTVLLFLRESRLINRDQHDRNGRTVYPRIIGLRDADLKNAKLRGAKLINADRDEPVSLEGAILEGADLQGADLEGADLEGADLRKAKLNRANLREAKLSGANLKGANLTNAQLALCWFLEGTTMPDGQTLKGETKPDGPTFEAWLERAQE